MLWPYAIKAFAEKLNKPKVKDDGVTPTEKFSGTITYITIKNHYTWGYTVYILDSRLRDNIYVLQKC